MGAAKTPDDAEAVVYQEDMQSHEY